MLRDAYGRPLETLRISVTERCNFKCFFCHSEGVSWNVVKEMSVEELELIAEALSKIGMKYVKFTGGEPLVRPDLVEIVRSFVSHGFTDVSLTTNGYLLSLYASRLREAGLKWVNVSLHTLNREKFKRITGVDGLPKVLEGLKEAKENDLEVRINVVVLKGINEDEILDIIKYSLEEGFSVHVIELHPVGKAKEHFDRYHSKTLEDVKRWLFEHANAFQVRKLHNRPRFYIGKNFVELVEPVSNPLFCAGCSRLRVSPDGKFYPCINVNDVFFDAYPILKSDLPREEKVEAVIRGVLELNDLRKPYHMWNMAFERSIKNNQNPKLERLALPKRAKLQFARALLSRGDTGEEGIRSSTLRVQGTSL